MKITKKIILILLCTFILSLNAVYAANVSASFNTTNETVKPGETIVLKLNTGCEDGITAVLTKVNYNSDLLTLENVEIADGWMNYGSNNNLEILINKAEKITELDVCSLKFKVSDTTKAGTIKITTDEINISDITGNTNKVNGIEKTITVKTEKEDTKDEEQNIEKKLDSIAITKAPVKVKYKEGEKFNKNGLEITAKYSDGTSKKVENYTYSPSKELKLEDTNITISYTEDDITKTVVQKIEIEKLVDSEDDNNKDDDNKENNKEDNKNESTPGNTNGSNDANEEVGNKEEGTTGNLSNNNKTNTNDKEVTIEKENTDKKDNTLANQIIPAAGEKIIIVPLAIITVLAIVFYIKYKKCKND